jgi:hypothetical protein
VQDAIEADAQVVSLTGIPEILGPGAEIFTGNLFLEVVT